jgi:hypothetical protein
LPPTVRVTDVIANMVLPPVKGTLTQERSTTFNRQHGT